MKKLLVFMTMLCVATSAVAPAMAKDEDENEPKIQVRFLLQPQAQIIQAKKYEAPGTTTPDSNGIGQEFFLRRTRVILAGRVNKWIHFFFETDNPNLGKNGNNLGGTFTQDGFIDFRFFDELKVAMGMILLPFSRNNRQSAASLMCLDYHGAVFGAWGNTNIWRDYGIEARGMVIDKVDYRVGVFRGFRGGAATNDAPRITGRVAYNFFDPESKFFYGGTYLGQSRHLSVGFGFDLQPEGAVNGKGKDLYYALTGDVFVDWPLGNKMAVTASTGFLFYSWGPKKTNPLTSVAMFGELGFLFDGLQPVFGFEWAQPLYHEKAFKNVEMQNFRAGLNYFIKGHNATVKIEYANTSNALGGGKIENRRTSVVTLQTQLLF